MAQKKNTKEWAIGKLRQQIQGVMPLGSQGLDSSAFKKWTRDTEVAIESIFGKGSRHISDFKNVDYLPRPYFEDTTEAEKHAAFISGLNDAQAILQSMIEEVHEYWGLDQTAETAIDADRPPANNKVLVVHGHDSGTKETVARFLTKIGLEPVILHEQANRGRTIIEKFEDYSDVSFALALLTPDDFGGIADKPKSPEPRARQNVIFEFAYLIGKLGRKRVIGLKRGEVTLPSDYAGVLYVPFDDAGAWRMSVVKELKALGYSVDANKAL